VEAFLVSSGIVAVAKIGDKTQLLAVALAARYRRPPPIVLGILLRDAREPLARPVARAWITSSYLLRDR